MLLKIPDTIEVDRKDFETMTVTLAKLVMLLCSREPFELNIRCNQEDDVVVLSVGGTEETKPTGAR